MPTATDSATVTVTFNTQNEHPWSFSPLSLSLGGPSVRAQNHSVAYTIVWKLSPSSTAGFSLLAVEGWTPAQPTFMSGGWVTKQPPQGMLAFGLANNNLGNSNVSFGYEISVTNPGIPTSVTSTDPEIVLQPPPG